MTNRDIEEMLGWCRKKLDKARLNWNICSSNKRLDGYEMAMLAVMSYLHGKKEDLKNEMDQLW